MLIQTIVDVEDLDLDTYCNGLKLRNTASSVFFTLGKRHSGDPRTQTTHTL
jgi:hypothetical protein